MRRAVGLDLNGWHDFAARDWNDEDSNAVDGLLTTIDGGFAGVVVEHAGVRIGGPQAILSPIGRGSGWGEVGARGKRRDLRAVWPALLAGAADSNATRDLRIAADALAVRADALALCIPDRPDMAEAGRQAVLDALAGPRRPSATLIWRSVALALAALDGGMLPQARDGLRILCVIHGADGLEAQSFVLRDLAEHPGWLAPERGGPGGVLCPEVGLARLLAEAEAAVASANPRLGDRAAETPRLPLGLLLAACDRPEPDVIRRDNGSWTLAYPPAAFRVNWAALPAAPPLAAADAVLLQSPLAARHRDGLAAWLGPAGGTLHVMAADAPALGALLAQRRIARGIPHYLDRLDQVSLAVLRQAGPVFEDLIPPDATVPGNREYVSAPITSMVWPAEMTTAQFFIRKGAREIRTWTTPEIAAPETSQRLEIRLRQKPAQGWANLLITAPEWEELRRAPIRLEWSALQVDPRSAQEVLDALRGPPPVVPAPVHYRAHIGLWDGSLRRPGLRALLQHVRLGQPDSLHDLAQALGSPYSVPLPDRSGAVRVYAVGTDGSLPPELDAGTERLFADTITRIADDLLQRRRRGQAPATNDALRCLTWCFARCPLDITRELAAVVRVHEQGESHPWLLPSRAVVVVFQGLGRGATDPALLREMIPRLADGSTSRDRLGALGMMLSRPKATPMVLYQLDRPDVSVLATRLVETLKGLQTEGKFGVHLKYVLLAVGGLLRVRALDPWALVAGYSQPPTELARQLDEIAKRLAAHPDAVGGAAGKLESARETAKLLRGKGGRPDILTFVEELPDG
jgi:hypothetical protein